MSFPRALRSPGHRLLVCRILCSFIFRAGEWIGNTPSERAWGDVGLMNNAACQDWGLAVRPVHPVQEAPSHHNGPGQILPCPLLLSVIGQVSLSLGAPRCNTGALSLSSPPTGQPWSAGPVLSAASTLPLRTTVLARGLTDSQSPPAFSKRGLHSSRD